MTNKLNQILEINFCNLLMLSNDSDKNIQCDTKQSDSLMMRVQTLLILTLLLSLAK